MSLLGVGIRVILTKVVCVCGGGGADWGMTKLSGEMEMFYILSEVWVTQLYTLVKTQ